MTKLKIAFIAHTKNPALIMNDPSFIYRCENLALALRELGHHVDLLHFSQVMSQITSQVTSQVKRGIPSQVTRELKPQARSKVKPDGSSQLNAQPSSDSSTPLSSASNSGAQYDIMVFHRPKYRFGFRRWLKKLRKHGILAIADFDDLVFDEQWAKVSPGVINQQVSLKQTRKNFRAHQKALQAFDWVTGSTVPIVERLQSMGINHAMLLPNAVHRSWLNTPVPPKPERPRLTYFPGTRSHDRDFCIAQPAIERYLHDHPEVQLQITGPLSQKVNCRSDQLLRFDKQPFQEYQHHIAQSWLNLAPLQDTLFNDHKSALKAIEGSFFNAATLASPIPDMQRLRDCGATLVPHAASVEDATNLWYQAIAANLPASAQACANSGLREKLQATNHIDQFCQQWLEWTKLGRA